MCARNKIHVFNFMDPPEWWQTVVMKNLLKSIFFILYIHTSECDCMADLLEKLKDYKRRRTFSGKEHRHRYFSLPFSSTSS
jgi:hypothetical protein